METTSSEELAQSRYSFEKLLSDLGLSIEPGSWLDRAYRIVDRFSNVYAIEEKQREFHRELNKEGELYFATHDVGVMYDVLPYLDTVESGLLKQKLQRVIKMELPSQETSNSNEARNIFWELFLHARLRAAGINANLGDPNPDILTHVGRTRYHIQCKRIFSTPQTSVLSNIRKAARQLRIGLENADSDTRGVIALSVERPLTEGSLMLVTDSEQTARAKIQNPLEHIYNTCGHHWLDSQTLIKDRRIVAVFLHFMAPGILKDRNIMIRASQIAVHNTWSQDENFNTFKRDFQPFKTQLNY